MFRWILSVLLVALLASSSFGQVVYDAEDDWGLLDQIMSYRCWGYTCYDLYAITPSDPEDDSEIDYEGRKPTAVGEGYGATGVAGLDTDEWIQANHCEDDVCFLLFDLIDNNQEQIIATYGADSGKPGVAISQLELFSTKYNLVEDDPSATTFLLWTPAWQAKLVPQDESFNLVRQDNFLLGWSCARSSCFPGYTPAWCFEQVLYCSPPN